MDTSTAAERIAGLGYDYAAQPKGASQECNLCGPEGWPVEVARQDRYGYPATLVVCRRCGLGFLSPRMTADGYAHFYAGVYRPLVSAYHGRLIDAETVQDDQRAYAAGLAGFVEPRLAAAPSTVLDIGGSTGVVAGVLAARFGARATVLDPSPDELAVARAAGMETIAGFAEDFDQPGSDQPERQWDLVLLCQTVDHLLDVRATLTAMRAMTSAAGHAFVDILDVDLVLRRAGAIERAAKIDHPYYLTRATAAAYFGLVGYGIVAERVTDDGHRGFLLSPVDPAEPDWPGLARSAEQLLAEIGAPAPPDLTAGDPPTPQD